MDYNKKRKHSQSPTLPINDYGKIPPQCVSIEENVLGRCLSGVLSAIISACGMLKPEMFYKDAHQVIFKAIQSRFMVNIDSINVLMITEDLKKTDELDGIGGPIYLFGLSGNCLLSGDTQSESMLIVDKFMAREMIRFSQEVSGVCFDDSTDISDVISNHSLNIINLRDHTIKTNTFDIKLCVDDNLKEIEHRIETGEPEGMSTSFKSLDKKFRFVDTDLVIIGARPSMGKTALITSIISNMANEDTPCGMISAEMSKQQLVNRVLQCRCRVGGDQIRTGNLISGQFESLKRESEILKQQKIYIDDTPAMNIMQIRAVAILWKMKYNIKILFIDYLQLLSGIDEKGKTREAIVSEISRGLKSLAKELKIPVVALCQLNRMLEARRGDDKRPKLSDLRESGAIEQDADAVIFIHRPEYYNIMEYADGTSTHGVAEIVISKHRNGSTGTVMLNFEPAITLFYEDSQHVPNGDFKSNDEFDKDMELTF